MTISLRPEQCISLAIIDDNDIDQFILQSSLRQISYKGEMKAYANGELVYHHIKDVVSNRNFAALPDIIFLDINMPVMDGFEFLEACQFASIVWKYKM